MSTITAPPAVRGKVAVSRNSGVKPLGFVVWFSVPDEDIKLGRLRSKWFESGLDPKPLPPAQKLVNAFKRAVRQQEGVTINEKDGTKTETDVRDFPESSERVEYHITRVTRDLKDRRIHYQGAVRVWFTKTDNLGNPIEEHDFKPLGDVPTKQAFEIYDAIKEAYDLASERVPGAKVRTIVRHVLKDEADDNTFGFGGINLRGKAGGIYYIEAKYEHDLERLAELLWGLYPRQPGRAYLHMIPLADGTSERELVLRHAVADSLDDTREELTDLAKLFRQDEDSKAKGATRDRALRGNVRDHHKARIKQIGLRLARYQDILGDQMAEADAMYKQLIKQGAKLELS
jgi:hypothetical protein